MLRQRVVELAASRLAYFGMLSYDMTRRLCHQFGSVRFTGNGKVGIVGGGTSKRQSLNSNLDTLEILPPYMKHDTAPIPATPVGEFYFYPGPDLRGRL